MTQPSEKSPEDRLREKLAAFDDAFTQTVLAYQKSPNPESLSAIVRGVIAHQAGAEVLAAKTAEKGDDVLLIEDLAMDSLSLVDLSFQAEEFVHVVIQLEDFPKIKTLGDLQAFLRQKAFPEGSAAS